jgi:hypothetical protein
MADWEPGDVRVLPLAAFGLRYRRYRLPDAEAEAALARSLARYGQIAPVVSGEPESLWSTMTHSSEVAAGA